MPVTVKRSPIEELRAQHKDWNILKVVPSDSVTGLSFLIVRHDGQPSNSRNGFVSLDKDEVKELICYLTEMVEQCR